MKRSLPPSLSARPRRKALLVTLGIALLVVGVLLGLIPVVPGTPLVLLGVGMVASHSSRGRWLRWRVGAWLRRRGLPTRFLEGRRRSKRRKAVSNAGVCADLPFAQREAPRHG